MNVTSSQTVNTMTMIEKVYDFGNLYKAYMKARRGKRWKKAVAHFEINLEKNLIKLQQELKDRTYKCGEYHHFKVFEPKERDILSNSFRDKVVQHSLCDNVIADVLGKHFIYDNCASQKGKGTDFGRNRLKHHLQRYYRKHGNQGYILKLDIKKFFYNIDHETLKQQIRPFFDDSIWWLIEEIIDSTEGKGIPIGNQTSQFFSIMYLSPLDHFIKEKLHIKYYGRYVDDFYLIHKSKEHLKYCLEEIKKRLPNVELNNKTQISKIKNGIEYLGFKYYLTDTGKVIMKLAKGKKHKLKRRLKKIRDKEYFELSYTCSLQHISKENTYYLRQKLKRFIKDLKE